MHYHLTITEPGQLDVRHADANTIYRDLDQARKQLVMLAQDTAVRMNETPGRSVAAADRGADLWEVTWTTDAGIERTRSFQVVHCSNPLTIKAADTSADSA